MAGLVLAAPARAQQPEGCRYVQNSPVFAEGFDGQDTFGFRLQLNSRDWGWGRAHGGAIMGCPTCPQGKIAKGVVRIGLAPFYPPSDEYQLRRETGQQEASAVDFALHPRTIAIGLWSMTNFMPRGVTPDSEITPIALLDIGAKARLITVNSAGNPVFGAAVAMQERCFVFYGLFFREDNTPVTLADLREIDQVLKLEKYTPRFNLDQLTPREPKPWIQFPLGDARKQWQEEERRRQLQQKQE
jgi:hypothetical protein